MPSNKQFENEVMQQGKTGGVVTEARSPLYAFLQGEVGDEGQLEGRSPCFVYSQGEQEHKNFTIV